MKIVHVIPFSKSVHTDTLSYFSARDVEPGTLVTVPLRKKEVKAIVIKSDEVTNIKSQIKNAHYRIRNVIEVHSQQVLQKSFFEACVKTAAYHTATPGTVFYSMLPKSFLESIDTLTDTSAIARHQGHFETKKLERSYQDRVSFYKTLTREQFALKKSIHIVCPTIAIVQQLHETLSSRIQEQCFILHSKLTKKKQQEYLQHLHQQPKPVVIISTPSYISASRHDVGTIVVEQESHFAWQQHVRPYIDTRVFLDSYARSRELTIVWADSFLSLERHHASISERWEQVLPSMKNIFDTRKLSVISEIKKTTSKKSDKERIAELKEKNKTWNPLTPEIQKILKENKTKKKKLFFFVSRKGLSPIVTCNDCGRIAVSPESGTPYSLYQRSRKGNTTKERIFICHSTGESIPAFDTCQFCESWNLYPMGVGTITVQQAINEIFPDMPVSIIDDFHTPSIKKQKDALKEFEANRKTSVLIGTLKALENMPQVDIGAVISIENIFSSFSYQVPSTALRIINHIYERSTEHTYVQSRNTLSDQLGILQDGMYSVFYESEIKSREQFKYPPFATIIKTSREVATSQLKQSYSELQKLFEHNDPDIITAPHPKRGYVWIHTLVRLPISQWNINQQDARLSTTLSALGRDYHIRINPQQLN